MQFKPSVLLAALVASGLSATVSAEQIETISILGARDGQLASQVSGALTILDEQQIRQSGAIYLLDLLRAQTGISISQSGPDGTIAELRMRGTEADHVLVLIDGVVANDIGQGGSMNFAHLSLDDVSRIEILRGAQSALWGSAAVGGVISITTTGNTQNRVKLEAGQDNSQHAAVNLSGQAGAVHYRLNASHISTDGSNVSESGEEKDGYRNQAFSAGINWQINDNHQLDTSVRYNASRSEFDSADFTTGFPADSDDVTKATQTSAQLSLHSQWQDDFDTLLAFYSNRNNNDNFGSNTVSNNSDLQRYVLQGNWHYAEASLITLAFEQSDEHFVQTGVADEYSDPNRDLDNQIRSVIVDVQQQISSQLSVTLSGRRDLNDVFANSNTFRLGASYEVTSALRTYVSLGTAVKNPSFVDRFGYYATSFYPFVGNPDLQPETSRSVEVGANWQIDASTLWQLSLFDSTLTNEINGYFYDVALGATTAVNRDDESQRRGVESSLALELSGWQLNLNYTYTDASQPAAAGGDEWEVRRPRHTGGIQLSSAIFGDQGRVSLLASYQGSRTDAIFVPPTYAEQHVVLDAYWLVGVNVQYALSEQLELTLRAQNLFNKEYEDLVGYRGAPQRLFAGVSWKF